MVLQWQPLFREALRTRVSTFTRLRAQGYKRRPKPHQK